MRLRELFTRARNAMDPLNALSAKTAPMPSGASGVSIVGVPAAREAVRELLQLPLSGTLINDLTLLLHHQVLLHAGDAVLSTNENWSDLNSRTKKVVDSLSSLLDTLKLLVGESPEHLISIRLPQSQDGGLDGLASIVGEFSKALEQPLRRVLKAELRVVGVDRGSSWIEVVASTAAAIKLVRVLVDTWQKYLEHKVKIRQLEASARVLEAEAETVESIARSTRAMEDKWLRKEAPRVVRVVVNESSVVDGNQDDEETIGIVVRSIETGAHLLAQGAAVDTRRLEPGTRVDVEAKLIEAASPPAQLSPGASGQNQ